MGRQLRLVVLLVIFVGLLNASSSSTPKPGIVLVHDDVPDNELESEESSDIVTPKVVVAEIVPEEAKIKKTKKTPITPQPLSDETLKDLLEASKHSAALAKDPWFSKNLPGLIKAENATKNSSNDTDTDANDEYDYYYGEDSNYEYDGHDNDNVKETTSVRPKKSKASNDNSMPKLHPIVDDTTSKTKTKTTKAAVTDKYQELDDSNYDDYDEDEDDDDENDDDNIADDEDDEIVFNENVPCARYCLCSRNVNSYLVATCSRLDPGTQHFGSDITDLVVTNVGPKYPILLGPKFFHQLGLKYVASIKIANCTIEYMHPEAFEGLEDLYAVNLTNVGLAIISPDTFAKNMKLRMLTISGNDLSIMSTIHYLLKSSSIEELDFSRNNLMELNPNAFTELTSIVYINLSQNNLQKIPEKVFDSVPTIEELDLSYNSLKELPEGIFNRTALAILHLKYNSFTGHFDFGANDLQQLDLSFNAISQVHHSMFDKMTGLTNLNLKGNGITKIQPDSFLTLKSLRHIDLSINELDQISSMLFFKNSELDVIRLNDNPRLSLLPTDGFLSYNGYFTVYYLDISNCAISALGHKTFSTMPNLATLKLAWNNINNLPRDTFISLTKLIDLDLSNNLISKLDENLFKENNELTKLNLAGNPISKLSVRLFSPLNKLRSLDVNDCELTSLLSDRDSSTDYKFFDTLRSFNASGNLIKKISSADIKSFKNLRSLDLTNNPLYCDDNLRDFYSYVSLHPQLLPRKTAEIAELQEDPSLWRKQAEYGWGQMVREVCKHYKAMMDKTGIELNTKKPDEDQLKLLTGVDKKDHSLSPIEKLLKDSSNVILKNKDTRLDDSAEEDLNNGGEDKDEEENADVFDEDDDDDDDDEDDDDDDDDDGDDDSNNNDETDANANREANKIVNDYEKYLQSEVRPILKNHGLKVEEVDLTKETQDKFLQNKLGYVSDTDDKDEDEIIIERGHIYYSGYKFLVPVILVVTCLVILLLGIAKLISVFIVRRGANYRNALQIQRNPFVYQKLTEDIVKPASKESKQPKVHRYAPINQV